MTRASISLGTHPVVSHFSSKAPVLQLHSLPPGHRDYRRQAGRQKVRGGGGGAGGGGGLQHINSFPSDEGSEARKCQERGVQKELAAPEGDELIQLGNVPADLSVS